MCCRQLLVKNLYNKLHDNSKSGLVADTVTDGGQDIHISRSVTLRKERLIP